VLGRLVANLSVRPTSALAKALDDAEKWIDPQQAGEIADEVAKYSVPEMPGPVSRG
jgi:hypothetical protein